MEHTLIIDSFITGNEQASVKDTKEAKNKFKQANKELVILKIGADLHI